MRNPKRIPIVLDLIQNNYHQFLIDCGVETDDVLDSTQLFLVKRPEIEQFWLENPDLRLGQVFVNMGTIENFPGFWYYKEETDYVVEKGFCKFEDIHFWGVNYTKEMVRLPETEFRLLKDLDIDHIRAIIIFLEKNKQNTNPKYMAYFKKRIEEDDQMDQLINEVLPKSPDNE